MAKSGTAKTHLEDVSQNEVLPPVRIALLGCGNVGGAFAQIIYRESNTLLARTGIRLELAGIGVRNPAKYSTLGINNDLFCDARELVQRDDIDLVVELIGGTDTARDLIEIALKKARPVVTANKALLARFGAELSQFASDNGVDLLYEAAAAGAIPVIRAFRESLAGEKISRFMGIVNGTTNYVLTQMTERTVNYEDALSEAQNLGYAEADPKADVEGHDAAAKAAILASLAFGSVVEGASVDCEGITGIKDVDVMFANKLGYVLKLLAIGERFDGENEISVRVHPTMVPSTHPLAAVRGSFNAVFVEGEGAGELMFYGPGAGGAPSASAVLGDVIDAARNLLAGVSSPLPPRSVPSMRTRKTLYGAFYICLDVLDQPAVLAAVAAVFGEHRVSIRAMEQVGLGDEARLIFLTHVARVGDVDSTLDGLRELEVVDSVGSVFFVIEAEQA